MQRVRTCLTCGVPKPVDDFYASSNSKCKECVKKRVHQRRVDYPDRLQEYELRRNKTEKRKQQLTDQCRTQRSSHPEKYKARGAVAHALRNGKLIKSPCEDCGTTENLEAHHTDYSKSLEVTWLCRRCHRVREGRLALV